MNVPLSMELFSNGEGHSHQKECCICTEPFGPDKVIKQTPCSHYFHEECLKPWLRVSKLCPLCRCNLEDALFPEGGRSGLTNRGPDASTEMWLNRSAEAQEQEERSAVKCGMYILRRAYTVIHTCNSKPLYGYIQL